MESKDLRGPQHIRDTIRAFMREGNLRRTSRDRQAFHAWIDAAGPDCSHGAAPVAFRSGRLTVEVDHGGHLQELALLSEDIRARANASLGNETIRKVVFKLRG